MTWSFQKVPIFKAPGRFFSLWGLSLFCHQMRFLSSYQVRWQRREVRKASYSLYPPNFTMSQRKESAMIRKTNHIMVITLSLVLLLLLAAPFVQAAERGKVTGRAVWYATNFQSIPVGDVEGHIIFLFEAKGITFFEPWGTALGKESTIGDRTKGLGPTEYYDINTFPDGSTITTKGRGESTSAGAGKTGTGGGEFTWTCVRGTGKFQGIQGGGTGKFWALGPGQWYADFEGEYTLP
jgi:hypothetical protein